LRYLCKQGTILHMKLITKSQQNEYEALKKRYSMDMKRESILRLSLEEDIDAPVKSCVMGLAILGCDPRWSCCGFDYHGQPIHKNHDYGSVYFGLVYNDSTKKYLSRFFESPDWMFPKTWQVTLSKNDGVPMVWLSNQFVRKELWDGQDSIHYSELAATRIRYLEYSLLSVSGDMAQDTILVDENSRYNRRFKFWQYPPKCPWSFTKDQFLERVHG